MSYSNIDNTLSVTFNTNYFQNIEQNLNDNHQNHYNHAALYGKLSHAYVVCPDSVHWK